MPCAETPGGPARPATVGRARTCRVAAPAVPVRFRPRTPAQSRAPCENFRPRRGGAERILFWIRCAVKVLFACVEKNRKNRKNFRPSSGPAPVAVARPSARPPPRFRPRLLYHSPPCPRSIHRLRRSSLLASPRVVRPPSAHPLAIFLASLLSLLLISLSSSLAGGLVSCTCLSGGVNRVSVCCVCVCGVGIQAEFGVEFSGIWVV